MRSKRCWSRAPRKPILLHGLDATVWPLLDAAFARGYSTRVGFEDGRTLPDGSVAPSNAALVKAALERRAPLTRYRARNDLMSLRALPVFVLASALLMATPGRTSR